MIDIGDDPFYAHAGTTVLNDFEKEYPYHWNLGSDVKTALDNALSNAGFSVVDLQAQGISYAELENLVVSESATWKIGPAKEGIARRLTDQLGVKAVVVLKQARSVAAEECPGGNCTYRFMDGPGLYTRTFFGVTSYWAVAAFKWNVFVLSPPADTAAAEPLASKLRMPRVRLRDFPSPANLQDISEAEFLPVHDAVVRFVETVAAEAAETLISQ